jgi:hypothetical protein
LYAYGWLCAGSSNNGKKISAWFDERVITRAMRGFTSTAQSATKEAQQILLQSKACVADFCSPSDQKQYSRELALLQHRQQALELVLDKSPDARRKVEEYIASFEKARLRRCCDTVVSSQ